MAQAEKEIISLIGPSGSGKSTISQIIAVKLKWTFIDSDREIEKMAAMSVADIFRLKGEQEFRAREAAFLKEFEANCPGNTILSTGGGMPVPEANWQLLASISTVVYLSAPLEVLVTRINHGENRPLLSGTDAAEAASGGAERANELNELKLLLGKLISRRESIYSRAQYKIDTSGESPEQLADKIISLCGVTPLNT